MQSIAEKETAVKDPRSFPTNHSTKYRSIHLAEGLTAEDKRLFLGARLRFLYRKLLHNSPISQHELADLVVYGSDAADGSEAAA
jgi:hypothetical protein